MARYTCEVELRTENGYVKINSTELVPGDIIKIDRLLLPCDLILISGSAIVNEAILTGESIPVMKTQLPRVDNLIYSKAGATKHTLYGGTTVIQSR